MRILFLAPFGRCRKQTTSRRMLPLAAGLARNGHTVEVLIPAWDCRAEAGQTQRWEGVTLRAPALGPAPAPWFDPMLQWRMRRAALDFRPDLVHVFKPIGFAGGLASWALRRGALRVVVDVDDLETSDGWGKRRPLGLRGWLVRQETRALRRAHGVTAASVALRERAAQMRAGRNDVLYLPNGLYRASEPAPVGDNAPIVLLYTRGNDVDPTDVAVLWRQVSAAVPDARLRVVGDWADAPPLPHTEMPGWLEGEALIRALRTSALALFPAQDTPLLRAKSPARLLDCMAQGLPIVSTGVGEYGLLAGVGSDDLAARVIALLRDGAARTEAGRSMWARAQACAWDRRVADLESWYGRMMTTPPGGTR